VRRNGCEKLTMVFPVGERGRHGILGIVQNEITVKSRSRIQIQEDARQFLAASQNANVIVRVARVRGEEFHYVPDPEAIHRIGYIISEIALIMVRASCSDDTSLGDGTSSSTAPSASRQ
jgi:hypothetical protein